MCRNFISSVLVFMLAMHSIYVLVKFSFVNKYVINEVMMFSQLNNFYVYRFRNGMREEVVENEFGKDEICAWRREGVSSFRCLSRSSCVDGGTLGE